MFSTIILIIAKYTSRKRKPSIKNNSPERQNYKIFEDTVLEKTCNYKDKPILYPCNVKECKFQGHNIKLHLESKAHLLSSETAKLQQSYLICQVNFVTKVSKVKKNAPVLCSKCHLSFDGIYLHLHNQHQIRRKTNEL